MCEDILISAEHVSKKFSRSFRTSLWYGVLDIASGLAPWASRNGSNRDLMSMPPLRDDEFWAVQNVSFQVRRGECLGLIGHNGAGKSSLLKMLNGLIPPDGGRITTRGRVGALIELNAGFNPLLSGRENIFNQAALLGFSRAETMARFDAIVDFSEMEEFLDMPVQNYSSGMRVRLGFAVSSQLESDVLVIDEVLAVGDVAFRHKCLQRMAELRDKTAMILVSHAMPQIYRICSHVMVLKRGAVIYHGDQLGVGIQTYYGQMETQEARVIGGDTIDLQQIRFESGGHVADEIEPIPVDYGDPLSISFRLHVHRDLKNVGVKLCFWNQELQPVLDLVADTMTNYMIEMNGRGWCDVEAVLDRVQLNTGRYTMTIQVMDESMIRIHGRADNVGRIVVKAPYPTGANQIAVGRWTVSPVTQP